MKKFLIYVLVVVIFVVVIGMVSFGIVNSNNKDVNINGKVLSEVKYLDENILEIMNKLNNLAIGPNINIEKKENKILSEDSSKDQSSGAEDPLKQGDNSGQESSQGSSENGSSNSGNAATGYLVKETPILLIQDSATDWNSILKMAEEIYSSWSTIAVDLNALNISNENILNFSSNLDGLILSLKNNDKEKSLICAANMYNLLPEYIYVVEGITQNYYITKIKAGVLKAYATIEADSWDIVNDGLLESNDAINKLINSELMLDNQNQSKIEEIYVLINELTKSANQKEKDIFMLKYVTLMEKIESL